MSKMSKTLSAIGYMLIFCISLPFLDSLTRILTAAPSDLGLAQVVWIRSVVCVLIFLPGIMSRKDYRVPKVYWKWYLLRSAVFFTAIWSWISVLDKVALPQMYALGFTAPILAALISVVVFKEYLGPKKILSLIGGFIGAMIIIRPGLSGFELISLIPLFSACNWALGTVLTKKLTDTQNPYFMTAFLSGSFAVITSYATATQWVMPSLEQWGILLIQGCVIAWGYASLAKALILADVSIVAPVEFSKLVFASLFAAIFFQEWIDAWTIVGGLIIFASAALLLKAKTVKP